MTFKRGRKQEIAEVEVQDGFLLKDFIDKIEKVMSGFEPTYFDELEIVFETFYEEYAVRMRISHWRPETDAEMEERELLCLRAQAVQETAERAMLAKLQEKYGR